MACLLHSVSCIHCILIAWTCRLLQMRHVVIPSWYQRPGYVRAMADLIEEQVGWAAVCVGWGVFVVTVGRKHCKRSSRRTCHVSGGPAHMAVARCGLPHPAAQRACCLPARPSLQLRGGSSPFPRELAEEVDIFFSAHGVPLSYIEEGERSGRMG